MRISVMGRRRVVICGHQTIPAVDGPFAAALSFVGDRRFLQPPTATAARRRYDSPDGQAPVSNSLGGLRVVALFEAVKALIVIGAGFGLLTLLHRDVRRIAESLVTRLHLDPDRRYPGLFIDAASRVDDKRLWLLAGLAVLYAALRLAEAYGLWFERRWAAWLGAASGGIYIPVEVYELIDRPSWVKAATLALNIGVIVYLLWTLRRSTTLQAEPVSA